MRICCYFFRAKGAVSECFSVLGGANYFLASLRATNRFPIIKLFAISKNGGIKIFSIFLCEGGVFGVFRGT